MADQDNQGGTLTPAELILRNPNHDAFWQARGLPKRPKDWKQRIANEKAAQAKRLQQEQKAAARQARSEREREAAARSQGLDLADRAQDAYDPFRRSRGADDDGDRGTGCRTRLDDPGTADASRSAAEGGATEAADRMRPGTAGVPVPGFLAMCP